MIKHERKWPEYRTFVLEAEISKRNLLEGYIAATEEICVRGGRGFDGRAIGTRSTRIQFINTEDLVGLESVKTNIERR